MQETAKELLFFRLKIGILAVGQEIIFILLFVKASHVFVFQKMRHLQKSFFHLNLLFGIRRVLLFAEHLRIRGLYKKQTGFIIIFKD